MIRQASLPDGPHVVLLVNVAIREVFFADLAEAIAATRQAGGGRNAD